MLSNASLARVRRHSTILEVEIDCELFWAGFFDPVQITHSEHGVLNTYTVAEVLEGRWDEHNGVSEEL